MTQETIQLLVWLGIAVVLGILEAATVALVSFWFAVGALAAMIPAYFGAPIWAQILVFLVISAVCLALTRSFFKDVIKIKKQPTNSDSLIGAAGVVSSKIENLRGGGKVYISGLTWSAKTVDGSEAEEGDVVTVERIEGATLYVTKQGKD